MGVYYSPSQLLEGIDQVHRLILPTQRMVAQPIDVCILGSTVIQGIPSELGECSTSQLGFIFSFKKKVTRIYVCCLEYRWQR